MPRYFWFNQNYPNLFNPRTHIGFELPESAEMQLSVFDLLGRHVRTIDGGKKPPGVFGAQWDALTDRGEPVSTGAYIIRLEAKGSSGTSAIILRKIIYLK